jgi:hypothetical protein
VTKNTSPQKAPKLLDALGPWEQNPHALKLGWLEDSKTPSKNDVLKAGQHQK